MHQGNIMSKVVQIDSFPREQPCQRCQELGFVNIFPSLDDKETHGKLHLVVDYEIPTYPSPSTELVAQILDSCFPRLKDKKKPEENPDGPRDAILIPNEEPMEILNEEPIGSSPSEHEEKPILNECLLCEFRCLQSEGLEQHWSHVAWEHLETPGIFGCSQCHSAWDTPKPFGEHLLLHHPGQEASLLDRRDLGACNIFQMCFGVSDERLAAAGLAHLFQQMEPPPSEAQSSPPKCQDNQLYQPQPPKGKVNDQCLLCGQGWVTFSKARADYRWKHLATCHLDNPHLFVCPVCQKGWYSRRSNFNHHIRANHPDKICCREDKRTDKDWEVHRMCFGATRRLPPRPKCSKKTKYKRSCSLCHHRVPSSFPKAKEYHLRWVHVSTKHAGGHPLFHCPLCNKSSDHRINVLNFCWKNHPDTKALVDNRKEMMELYQRCFLIASAAKTG